MSDTVIRVENLSKKYMISHQQPERYRALRDMIANGAKSLSQKLIKFPSRSRPDTAREEFWALKDICFDIKQGDRVGIIGRNGAGKSTLLKILSQITEPTTGRISIKGRVASLLEVGTGFHPELSGRENIYLNGAILGMSRAEIKKNFDEIVAFAEIEQFLDTPVKRYSSGMYVRLAFAVAAHLEPEILVVDEVLAVGDAKFQSKCLGKMKDVSREQRTVLFVSHQMGMIAQLCSKALLLERGKVIQQGNSNEVISYYIESLAVNDNNQFIRLNYPIDEKDACILETRTLDINNVSISDFGHTDVIILAVKFAINKWVEDLVLGVTVKDLHHRKIFTNQVKVSSLVNKRSNSEVVARMKLPSQFLTPGQYYFSIAFHIPNIRIVDEVEEVCRFRVIDMGSEFAMYEGVDYGCVFAHCDWEV